MRWGFKYIGDPNKSHQVNGGTEKWSILFTVVPTPVASNRRGTEFESSHYQFQKSFYKCDDDLVVSVLDSYGC